MPVIAAYYRRVGIDARDCGSSTPHGARHPTHDAGTSARPVCVLFSIWAQTQSQPFKELTQQLIATNAVVTVASLSK